MNRTGAYVNELNRLKQDAAKLVDAIKEKNSEILVENAVKLAFEEIRTMYIREAESLIDAIAQRKVHEIESEESRLGPMAVKGFFGILARELGRRAEQDDSLREPAEAASEGYRLDDTEKTKIRQTREIVKERVRGQALSVKPEDFMKSVRGRKALLESLNAMFKEERDSPRSGRKVRL
ncbi:MAG: hypothetical protein ABSD73_12790 [Candidatus Bathyarchaeia archaeon]|jgi:hypothetical protein